MQSFQLKDLSLPVKVLTRSKQPQDVVANVSVTLDGVSEEFAKWDEVTDILSTRFSSNVITAPFVDENVEPFFQIEPGITRVGLDIGFNWPVERALLNYTVSVPEMYQCEYRTWKENGTLYLGQQIVVPVIMQIQYPRKVQVAISTTVKELIPFEFYVVEVERLSVSSVFPVLESKLVLEHQPKKTIHKIIRDITESLRKHPMIEKYTVHTIVGDVYGVHDVVLEHRS